ncbi:acyl-coenzyme A diphosphatase FITM2 [Chrysoperla carnea]|uniref:acyl-coenzyme A diphosphatase FITM2 n=1 Tax=Chrysoperla carnea TaxID=189513 RepID=UPI001D05F978|nr:acyl-coenzyme A diphosphatase FITM2 [Chrysoperla carnea]
MSKRRPIHSNPSRLNFRSMENPKTENRGTRPTAEPTSVQEIFTLMVLHVCKKSIFFDINLKVALYLGALFLLSLITDFLPFPKTYFARSDNLFNQYFVKFAWGWNLLLLIPFVTLSSLTYCCGNIRTVVREHLPRIAIATFFWLFWIKFFNFIETTYGKCNNKQYDSKPSCLKAGLFWNGFDISGHSFILIYGSLMLIEEARVIIGWETIKENLRNEQHNRSVQTLQSNNILRNLSEHELIGVKVFYEKFTIYVRILFIAMTVLQILWDVMLISTMLYYHIMAEKFVGGSIAILTWYFTYRFWFKQPNLLPRAPGDGSFKYTKAKDTSTTNLNRKASFTMPTTSTPKSTPKFMGMPIYKPAETNTSRKNGNGENIPNTATSLR